MIDVKLIKLYFNQDYCSHDLFPIIYSFTHQTLVEHILCVSHCEEFSEYQGIRFGLWTSSFVWEIMINTPTTHHYIPSTPKQPHGRCSIW